MPTIRFINIVTPGAAPSATTDGQPGQTLFDCGGRVGAGIETACVGKGTCGLCRVKIISGNQALVPFTDDERRHLGNVFHITQVRLACRCRLLTDAELAAAESAPVAEIVVEPVAKRKKKLPK